MLKLLTPLSAALSAPGANIDAKNVETLYLAHVRRLSPHFDVELAVGSAAAEDRRQGNAASGGPPRLSLTSSVGPAGTAGLAYNIAGNWNLYASYSVSQVKTKLDADTAGVIRTTHISFGPQALVVSVGYSF